MSSNGNPKPPGLRSQVYCLGAWWLWGCPLHSCASASSPWERGACAHLGWSLQGGGGRRAAGLHVAYDPRVAEHPYCLRCRWSTQERTGEAVSHLCSLICSRWSTWRPWCGPERLGGSLCEERASSLAGDPGSQGGSVHRLPGLLLLLEPLSQARPLSAPVRMYRQICVGWAAEVRSL